jgi:integrase
MRGREGHRRAQLTKRAIDTARPESERYELWDEALPGFALRVTPTGVKTFILRYRTKGGGRRAPKRFVSIGRYGALTPDQARAEARTLLGNVAQGRDPAAELRKAEASSSNALQAICEKYLKRERKKLRTADWREKVLTRLVYPKLGARQIDDIKRSEIVRLLDDIEDENGPVMADRTLAVIRKIMNSHAGRSDDFRSPIVKGMARTKPKERAGTHVLSDDDLRAVWRAAEISRDPFGIYVQFLLLTAARRTEAARMTRQEVTNGDWVIPAARMKNKIEHAVPLSVDAKGVLAKVPMIGRNADTGFVFTTNGKTPISGFTKFKQNLDTASGVTGWKLHDLRRTCATLMNRAGIPPDHVDRALAHVVPGVSGVYNRHDYYDEKRRAFEALALQIRKILNPEANVVSLKGSKNARSDR